MQSPEREFSFVVSTPMGGVMVKFQDVEWSEPGRPLFYPKTEYAFDTFADWLEGSARNSRGYGFDLESSFSPRSLHEALTCAKTVGNSDVTDFVFLGLPPEDDGEEEDDDGAVLEAAQVMTPLTVEENIQRGTDTMRRVLTHQIERETRAMYRKELGWITFYYGEPGKTPPEREDFDSDDEMRSWWNGLGQKEKKRLFSSGKGVSHIVAKREWEGKYIKALKGQTGKSIAFEIVKTLAEGHVIKTAGERALVIAGKYQAALALTRYEKATGEKEEVWLLSGMEIVEDKDYDLIFESSGSSRFSQIESRDTHFGATLSRPEVGADDSRPAHAGKINIGTGGVFGKDILESSPSWRDQIMAATTWEGLKDAFAAATGITVKPLRTPSDKLKAMGLKLQSAGFRSDNPGGSWLQDHVEDAQDARKKGRVTGAITASFRDISLPVGILAGIEGQKGEQNYLGDADHQKRIAALAESLKKNGFDPEATIAIDVEFDGRTTVYEGNHRIQAAKLAGLDRIPVEVRYLAGGETQAGPLDPERVLRAIETVEAPKGPKSLAEMTNAEYRRMVYDAAIAAMKAGKTVVIATQTKARQVIPQTLGFGEKKGTILHYEGKTAGWVAVEFQALDSLAHGLGLPTAWDHTKAVSNAEPEEAYDPAEDEKPSLTMEQMDFSIGQYLDVPETQAIKALTAENVADVIQNALEEQYRELLASYIRGERPDLMDVIDGKDAVPPVAEVEVKEPATVVAKKSYFSLILAGLDTNEMTSKLVSVKGSVKGTDEKGEGMMYAKDALEGIAADVEDYSRLLECL